ncbi:MAG TPA: hypothetical protein VFT72_14885 [Opitutaceae bacterium]|nr:hypothetical protein [Opitutaceae bacterium]
MSCATPASGESESVDWQGIVRESRRRLDEFGPQAAPAIESELEVLIAQLAAETGPASSVSTAVGRAEAWLLLGQLREMQSSPEKLTSAIDAYVAAGEVARGLSPRQVMLAAMNRGNALGKLARFDAAVVAYDEALEGHSRIEADDPALALSLGALHLNRGAALQSLPSPDLERAMQGFQNAIEALERVGQSAATGPAEKQQARYLLAGTRLNLAVSLLERDFANVEQASVLTAAVGESVRATQTEALSAADFAMRALRLACEIGGRKIAALNPAARSEIARALNDCTDAAEEALALAAHWERRDVSIFRPAVSWFIAFASALYAHHQPHFLGEFLVDVLRSASTPQAWVDAVELDGVALRAIDAAQNGLRGWLFHEPQSADAERHVEALESLRRARQQFEKR